MAFSAWLSLFTICLLGAMSPGPSLAMVTKHTLAGGRLNGIATAWAHALGIGTYAFLTIIGLSIVLQKAQWLFQAISLVGAVYLAYLGWKALRSQGGVATNVATGMRISVWQSAKEGLMISILNPKIALFFTALFSQFITLSHDVTSRTIVVMTPLIVDGLWYTLLTLLFSSAAVLTRLKRKAVLIDRISGVVLIALACRIVVNI
ncbi:LysE family translocator [Vibrio gazogenes]|uniref:Threonine/homoserine/homoserine lactone efflux protein n=2 Tax=Vibrio gazogenes TaxID=687 RepID=A0A1M4TCF5_VIBGA|nr:LysE family translocator [Vibrio gazogenes]ASA57293.1 lysine transporter LysE [Vibrio gazogenes]USP16064.1 LysE family translocator [Vibrio gazogenes]SHE42182.1 Threonine/homoserine/homoserine lactone efflux protein [Vibrio gazogenes DSM 21264] [Vibrio gazogenes DSM 21264 = NBRC 103151]SJN54269.1 Threonine efflux protein [Vibrio gazogenes]